MTSLAMERSHFELGLAPVADAFAGTVNSDVVSMKRHNRVRFVVVKGAGGTGTSTVTIEACDDTTPSNVSAIPFRYRRTVAGSNPGAWAEATAAGFTTTAAANEIYECEVEAEKLSASGYGYVRLTAVEVANDPVLGGILIEMLEPVFSGPTPVTATS